MVNTRGFARLGMLAVGLGIGAMWAHTPVAAADSSNGLVDVDRWPSKWGSTRRVPIG
jgi:hypothetical protein